MGSDLGPALGAGPFADGAEVAVERGVHLAALVGGSVFDAYGSYDRAFVLMLVLSVIALGLTLTLALPRPRVPGPPGGVT